MFLKPVMLMAHGSVNDKKTAYERKKETTLQKMTTKWNKKMEKKNGSGQ